MKLTYSKQITVCAIIILVFNILTTVLKHWVFHSIGFILCGLLWIINPVMIHDTVPTPRQKKILKIFDCVLIFWGIISRAYLY